MTVQPPDSVLAEIRLSTVRALWWILWCGALPVVGVSLALQWSRGSVNPFFIVESLAFVSLSLGLRGCAQRSVKLAGWWFLCHMMLVSAMALLGLGPFMGLAVILWATVLLSYLIIGLRGGVVGVVWSALLFVLGAVLFSTEVVTPPMMDILDLKLPRNVFRMGGAAVVGMIAMLVLVHKVVSRWRQAQSDALDAQRQAQEAQEAQAVATAALQQAQRLEALGRLAGGVAHDFNNSLTIILTAAHLLEITEDEDERAELLADIIAAGQGASEVTGQLLAFGQRPQQNVEPCDPSKVVSKMSRNLSRLMSDNVTYTFKGQSTRKVALNAGQVERVILNLVLNARDAMPRGGALCVTLSDTARLSPLLESSPVEGVLMTVTDEGVGMDEVTQGRLFEPFFTRREEYSPDGMGTGLGLPTVYGVVRSAKGHIEVSSVLGEGSTFEVFLPADDVSP